MKMEGISTLFIHGFPWALSYLLDHFLLFLKCACDVGFESILKMWLCNDSRLYKNAYKVLFWKYLLKRDYFERCFENDNVSQFCNGSRLYKNVVVPQNFPSHISQNILRKISKLLKVVQGLPDKLSPKAVYPKLGFHIASRYLSPSGPKCSTLS